MTSGIDEPNNEGGPTSAELHRSADRIIHPHAHNEVRWTYAPSETFSPLVATFDGIAWRTLVLNYVLRNPAKNPFMCELRAVV
ncbi:MAG: hypothetical protein ABIS07_18660 [Dokdonella sp.]